jgi:hypothetical protein
MKKLTFLIAVLLTVLFAAFTFLPPKSPFGFEVGSPEIKSISSLAFGPDGVLFIGDSKGATVFALDTKDVDKVDNPKPVDIKNVDQKIADDLGAEPKNIMITEMVVNPMSKKIYWGVQSADGTPVLLRMTDGNIEQVPLKNVSYSKAAINNPVADKDDRWGRTLAISDLLFADGSVLVTGMSNQEFGSTFRVIPFPFSNKQDQTSLEIYHAAHGKYETQSPVNTFTTAEINGKKYLLASYTCTPLVLFPMDELKAGKHIKGRTVGEFGAGNRPLDMVTMKKGDDLYLVISNSDRPLMKIAFKDIAAYQGSLTSQVEVPFSTAGVPYISLPMTNVTQLDRLDEGHYVFVQRRSNGDLDMRTGSNEWF